MLGEKTDKDFKINVLRAMMYNTAIMGSVFVVFHFLAGFLWTSYAGVFLAIMTAITWAAVYVVTFLSVSLSPVSYMVEWSQPHADSIMRTFSFQFVLWSFIGVGAAFGIISNHTSPMAFITFLVAMSMFVSLSAAKKARSVYYKQAVEPRVEKYEFDNENWASGTIRLFAKVVTPRFAGDYSRFGWMPVITVMMLLVHVFVGSLPALLVWTDPTETTLSLSAGLVSVIPLVFWSVVAGGGRWLSERRRYNPNSVMLSPGV